MRRQKNGRNRKSRNTNLYSPPCLCFLRHEFRFFSGLIPSLSGFGFRCFSKKRNQHSFITTRFGGNLPHTLLLRSVPTKNTLLPHRSCGTSPSSVFPGQSPASHLAQHVRKQVGKAQSQRKSLIFPTKIGKNTQDHTRPVLILSSAAGFIFNLTNTSQVTVSLL